MIELKTENWLKLFIAVGLPAVSCFGLYSIGKLDEPDSLTVFLTIVAYPAILIGVAAFTKMAITGPFSWQKSLPWLCLVAIPALFLAAIWL